MSLFIFLKTKVMYYIALFFINISLHILVILILSKHSSHFKNIIWKWLNIIQSFGNPVISGNIIVKIWFYILIKMSSVWQGNTTSNLVRLKSF